MLNFMEEMNDHTRYMLDEAQQEKSTDQETINKIIEERIKDSKTISDITKTLSEMHVDEDKNLSTENNKRSLDEDLSENEAQSHENENKKSKSEDNNS
jgi:hypothetical protein